MLKRAFPVRSRTPQAKERSQHLRLATDSSKLRCCGCKLATVSLSPLALPSSRAQPPTPAAGRLGLAHHACLPRTFLAHPTGAAPHGPAAGPRARWAPQGSGRDFLGKASSTSRACPTHLCLLHKERQRCDPAQAAVWRFRLAVLVLQHIARAAAADSPSIG